MSGRYPPRPSGRAAAAEGSPGGAGSGCAARGCSAGSSGGQLGSEGLSEGSCPARRCAGLHRRLYWGAWPARSAGHPVTVWRAVLGREGQVKHLQCAGLYPYCHSKAAGCFPPATELWIFIYLFICVYYYYYYYLFIFEFCNWCRERTLLADACYTYKVVVWFVQFTAKMSN